MFLRHNIGGFFSGESKSTARSLRFCGLLLFFWLWVLPSVGLAQKDFKITAADTSSPRDTLRSFIDGCNVIYETIKQRKVSRSTQPRARGHGVQDPGLP